MAGGNELRRAQWRERSEAAISPAGVPVGENKDMRRDTAGRSTVARAAMAALLVIAAGLVIHMQRELNFFRDEWIFVVYRDGGSLTNVLSSHAGHLVVWPVMFYVSMFRLVGLDHYELYQLATIPWFLGCSVLTYLVARQRGG